MIGIVNYNMGNIGSVKKQLDRIKAASFISGNPKELRKADKLILPGVGFFSKAVYELKLSGLWELLFEEVIGNKKPILGICLGMQLMANYSEEGDKEGFGWFNAEVVHFDVQDKLKYKIPHIGWNNVKLTKKSKLVDFIPASSEFYFVHSYHIKTSAQEDVLAVTEYEYPFVSALEKKNIYGVQFHPEKSHDVGKQMLTNFLKL